MGAMGGRLVLLSRAGLLIDYPPLAGIRPQELMDFPEHVTCSLTPVGDGP